MIKHGYVVGPSWPCPKCNSRDTVYTDKDKNNDENSLWTCYDCRHKFTFRDGVNHAKSLSGVSAISPDYKPRRTTRVIGQVVGGYEVVGVHGAKVMWRRSSRNAPRNFHYIVDYGTKRILSTFEEDKAETCLYEEEINVEGSSSSGDG